MFVPTCKQTMQGLRLGSNVEFELHQLANEISTFVVSQKFQLIVDEVMQEDMSQISVENFEEGQRQLGDFQPEQMINGNISYGSTFDFSQTFPL